MVPVILYASQFLIHNFYMIGPKSHVIIFRIRYFCPGSIMNIMLAYFHYLLDPIDLSVLLGTHTRVYPLIPVISLVQQRLSTTLGRGITS